MEPKQIPDAAAADAELPGLAGMEIVHRFWLVWDRLSALRL